MELIAAAATVLGALATIAGLVVAMRGRPRSGREQLGVEQGKPSYRFTGVSAAQLELDTAVEITDNLLATDSADYGLGAGFERVGWKLSPEWIERAVEQNLAILQRGVVVQKVFMVVDETHRPRTAARTSWSMRLRASWPARRSRPAIKPSVPIWATRLMPADDARRYAREWGAHLYQLIDEGQLKQARRDRRMLVLAGLLMAVALRARHALGRVS